jgi:hypothetical protein
MYRCESLELDSLEHYLGSFDGVRFVVGEIVRWGILSAIDEKPNPVFPEFVFRVNLGAVFIG